MQVGTKEVFRGKTAKIFNFSRGIFRVRSTTYPVAVPHSNRLSERSLPNLDLGMFCTFERCKQFDFLYLQEVVPVNIFGLSPPFRTLSYASGVIVLSLWEGAVEIILALVFPCKVQDVAGDNVES